MSSNLSCGGRRKYISANREAESNSTWFRFFFSRLSNEFCAPSENRFLQFGLQNFLFGLPLIGLPQCLQNRRLCICNLLQIGRKCTMHQNPTTHKSDATFIPPQLALPIKKDKNVYDDRSDCYWCSQSSYAG